MVLTVIVAAATTLGVLAVGGVATSVGPWYAALIKPKWTPPNWLFGPAWTLILGLAAWCGVIAWSRSQGPGEHALVLILYGVNIVLHLAWSPLFFNLRRPDLALAEIPFLWASILALMVGLAPAAGGAVWLLAPYLAWVSFAAVLNAVIVMINPPFGSSSRVRSARTAD
jgi:tryptophan-rich sensory protein